VRIIHVAPTPFGAAGLYGGGERYPLELARALVPDVECELLSFGRRSHVEREPGGLVRRTLRAVGWLGGHPAHPIAPGLVTAVSGAHVVHTHHMRSLPSGLAAVVARARGMRTAVTDHGLQGPALGVQHLFDAFLTVSAFSARELGCPPARTSVIYGGADPLRYTPDPAMGRDGILFVGRLTPHKGVDRLIEALPAGARLTVVGSAGHDPRLPERDYPALLCKLSAAKDVSFLGAVADDVLPLLYRSAAVMVLPSVDRTCYGKPVRVSELLGLSVLEAMASGTPVVASRIGGVGEIVDDGVTGFLVPPGDTAQLHARLDQVLRDGELARRMGRAARELVLERFTWSAVARRCLQVYETAISAAQLEQQKA
jgi:glycosyltransferase involved in cell wall biosynthesis